MKILKKIVIWGFVAAIIYSYFTREVDLSPRNEKNIEALKKNEGEYFSFIVLGDNHNGLIFNDSSFLKLIWHINREDRFRKIPIDFVMIHGDVTLDGKRKHFEAYKKMESLIKWPVIAGVGNHDNNNLFEKYIGKREFAFSDRNSYFIMRDNAKGHLTDKQLEWFGSELIKGSSYKNIFVSLHKPSFNPYQQDWYNYEFNHWAYRFMKLCEKHDVKMVFAGHRHMFKESEFGGVKYIVSGGGGMLIEIPESEGGFLHYLRVQVNRDYVSYEVRKISPPLWEIIVYYMWKEMVYGIRNLYGTGYIFGKNNEIKPLLNNDLIKKKFWYLSKIN